MYVLKFKEEGFSVDASTGAEELLRKLRDGASPAVIVFDIIMPGVDGIEFLEILKKENLAPSATLIVLSNQGQEKEIARAKKLGADEYIVKASAIPSEIVEKVAALVKKRDKS